MKTTSRSQKALLNTIAGFMDEFVSLICGLILPRLILLSFGSDYNGITSSVTQFISIISLMKAGIGGVTRVALYKPLAENDYQGISAVVVQTEKFMRKVALIFVGFSLFFAATYPFIINNEFDWLFSFTLILIISISTFAQYYFGLTYQMVLNADQKQSITLFFNMATTIANTIISVLIIKAGGGIHMVKLGSSAVFVISPLLLSRYVIRKYHIDKSVNSKEDLIKQRWDAVGHEVANFVNNNTDIMVLTIFTSLTEVSVYTVYHYVIVGIRKIIVNFITGFGAAFGNMYVKKEYNLMQKNLRLYELIVFSLTAVIYSVTLVMIVPFAKLYTIGVTDADYIRPLFAAIYTMSGVFSCLRIPYETIVKAVGHYKQTRNGAFMEAAINITVSIIFVIKYGLIGVAIGSLCAAVFRTFQYALYLGRVIMPRSFEIFIKHLFIVLCINACLVFLSKTYMIEINNVKQWLLIASVTGIIACAITLITDLLFYRNDTKELYNKMKHVFAGIKK